MCACIVNGALTNPHPHPDQLYWKKETGNRLGLCKKTSDNSWL